MNKDNKKLIVESIFIKEALKKGLSLEEFLVLLYFDNSYELEFDLKKISKVIKMDDEAIMNAFSTLLEKKIITLNTTKNDAGKVVELISLDNFYNDLNEDLKKKKMNDEQKDIFSIFESEFGRTLSLMDYEIIKAWIEKGFSEELIIGALKEAVYNGVTSLRYIDKILFEWQKKGLKTMDDVNNHLKNKDDSSRKCETEILSFNWLDDNHE